MLNKKQFFVLTSLVALSDLESGKRTVSQRDISKTANMSIGSVNKTINELSEMGLVEDGKITSEGLKKLEPYRVKRIVFLAAGFGSRMVPITLNTPKPLVRVKGQRIIDSLIDAAIGAGIEEIYIVRGYLAEQFDQLLYKYPMIKFIENLNYNEANNILSAVCARDFLKNAYVCEADLLLYNKQLISKYQYASNYLGVPVEKTDDWCFTCGENGRIKKFLLGGVNCYHMYGISYWTETDGERLKGHIKEVYDAPGGKERYWDQAALEYYSKEYNIYVRECTFDDVIEIDTIKELKALDRSYDY